MNAQTLIRPGRTADLAQIESLYRETFPSEDLVPLVRGLARENCGAQALVAEKDGAIIAHVALTPCVLAASTEPLALLGPLAVKPACQKRGLGSRLVREGLSQLNGDGFAAVFVLGDPNYYERFGFTTETYVTPPYPLVPEYRSGWQSLMLAAADRRFTGQLTVPTPWQHEALWMPQ